MSGVLAIFTNSALLLGATTRVAIAFVNIFRGLLSAFLLLFTLLLSLLTSVKANGKFLLLLIGLIVVVFFGVGGVYYTSDTLNVIDAVNTCLVRPSAEVILKFPIHFIRALWEYVAVGWNVVLRYLWEECVTIMAADFQDWYEFLYNIAVGATNRFDDSLTGYLTLFGDIGSIFTLIFEVPYILWSAFECGAYAWTEPRALWTVPVGTNAVGGDTVPRFFTYNTVPISPTNAASAAPTPAPTPAPIAGPAPTPAPTTPPPSAPPVQPRYFTNRTYEFNPRYGAFQSFLGNGSVAKYVRRVIVGFQNYLASVGRTLTTLLRTLRRPTFTELWGALITDIDSEESLWGAASDTFAYFFAAIFNIVTTIDNERCLNIPPTNPAGDAEFSQARYAIDHLIFRIARGVGGIGRALSLIAFNLVTSKPNGTPFVDFWVRIANGQTVSTKSNLLARELQFCRVFKEAGFRDVSGSSSVRRCDYMQNHFVAESNRNNECKEWDGIRSSEYFENEKLRVSHANVLFASIYDSTVGIIPAILDTLEIASCGSVNANDGGLGDIIDVVSGRFDRLRGAMITQLELVVSVVYMIFVFPCSNSLEVYLELVFKYAAWLIDELVNRYLPKVISIITNVDCIYGQNLFYCIVTQLSLLDPTGIFEALCEIVHALLDALEVAEGIINAVIGVVENVVNAIVSVLQPIITVIARVINTVVKDIAEIVASICEWIPGWDDCDSIVPSMSFSGFNLGQANFGRVDMSFTILMPCNEDDYIEALDDLGPILKKRSPEEVTWLEPTSDEGVYVLDRERFVQTYYPHLISENKARRSEKNGPHATFDDTQKEKADDVKRTVREHVQKHSAALQKLGVAATASDARTLYRAFHECFVGDETVESHYALCQRMQTPASGLNEIDKMCVDVRCARLASECMRDYMTDNARTVLNSNAANNIADSWLAWPFKTTANSLLWLTEAIVCESASEQILGDGESASRSLQNVLAVGAFLYDGASRVKYILENYGAAYHTCLHETHALANGDLSMTDKQIIENYVNCLEEPYVNDTWSAPEDCPPTGQCAFQAYLNSQDMHESPNTGVCVGIMHKYGLIFEDNSDTASSSADQIVYRLCAAAHAFGTRATLATHIAAQHGADSVLDVKIAERTSKMWAPLPNRHVNQFMSSWRAPIAVSRAAEFLSTPFYDFVTSAKRNLLTFVIYFRAVCNTMSVRIARILRGMLSMNYAPIAASLRYVDMWADIWDELVDPRDMYDRLVGRSEKAFVEPAHREHLVRQWYADVQRDVDELMTKGTRLRTTDDRTYAAFRQSGWTLHERRSTALHHKRDEHLYEEMFEGVNDDGYEVYTVNLDRKRSIGTYNQTLRASPQWGRKPKESIGEVFTHFARQMTARLDLKAESRMRAMSSSNHYSPQRDDVSIDIIATRPEHYKDRVRLDARVAVDWASQNMSATWNYESYKHIDLQSTLKAVRAFIARAEANHTLAEEIGHAMRAQSLLVEITGPDSSFNSSTLSARVEQLKNLTRINSHVTAYTLQRAREAAYKPIQATQVGGVISALMRIVDRRVRFADLPPVQAFGMMLNALGSNDAVSLAAWLAGDLGYVNGIGFVPRIDYEMYMQQADAERATAISLYQRPHNSPVVSMRKTPFFLPSYDVVVRNREQNAARRASMIQRMRASYQSVSRKRHMKARMSMLVNSGRWEREITHGEEHHYHMTRRLAPHIHDHVWRVHGVNASDVHRIMSNTTRAKRSAHEHAVLRRSVAVGTSASEVPGLGDLLSSIDWTIDLVSGRSNVLQNALNDIGDSIGVAFNLLKSWDFASTIENYIDSFTCTVPDDYSLDSSTGSYGWGCLFMGYLPERLFFPFGLWPTNNATGDIPWPDEAYVGGVAVGCETIGFFEPEAYCTIEGPDPDQLPLYESLTDPRVCVSTRDGSGNARMCLTGRDANGGSFLDSMPLCPVCEYCEREFESCDVFNYGTNVWRNMQVYMYHLERVWQKIWDIENNFIAYTAGILATAVVLGAPTIFTFSAQVTLFALISIAVSTQPLWVYPLLFGVVLLIVYDPLMWLFLVFQFFRILWYENTATFQTIFSTTRGADPFEPPFYNVIALLGDFFETIADINFSVFQSGSTVGTYLTFLNAWADDLRIFEGSGAPSNFETLCSFFSVWSVLAFIFIGFFFVSLAQIALQVVGSVFNFTLAVAVWLFTAIGLFVYSIFAVITSCVVRADPEQTLEGELEKQERQSKFDQKVQRRAAQQTAARTRALEKKLSTSGAALADDEPASIVLNPTLPSDAPNLRRRAHIQRTTNGQEV